MSKKREQSETHSPTEKAFAPFAFFAGTPTNPVGVPFSTAAPEGLALVCSAPTPSEADLVRQILQDAGFHVEFVPAVNTGAFGTSGSIHVFVRLDQEKEAREFLDQLQEKSAEEQEQEDET
jgi:hypothetical protein